MENGVDEMENEDLRCLVEHGHMDSRQRNGERNYAQGLC